jgi:probable HAF family extracellular repeat protein
MSRVSPTQAAVLSLTTMLLLIGCGPDTTAPSNLGSLSLRLITGNGQSGVVGTELPQPLVIRVEDSKGNGIGGATVNFRVTSGGGRMFAGVAITNSKLISGDAQSVGKAEDFWTLGTSTAQLQRVEVTAVIYNSVPPKQFYGTFTATALPGAAAHIVVQAGDGQIGTISTSVPLAPAVLVTDQYGNPVPALGVTFGATFGGGSVTGGGATTNTNGIATVGSWTLGSTLGANTLMATASGSGIAGNPVTFTANATTIVDLGTLGGFGDSQAWGVSGSGQVVGYSETGGGGNVRGFLWQNGTFTQLAFAGGADEFALDVNDYGHAVGYEDAADALQWQNGTVTRLGTLGNGSTFSEAYSINNSGQIAGRSTTDDCDCLGHAVLWQNGTIIDLGTLGGAAENSSALAINDKGQVVGSSQLTAGGPYHAFLWWNGTMTDLGTLGGSSSGATGINNNGQIVGSSITSNGDTHAFLWQNGVMTDLGTLGGVGTGSVAFGISDKGQVVGQSQLTAGGPQEPFIWVNGRMTHLATLGGNVTRAQGINNNGQIVGLSRTSDNSAIHAVLWIGF